MVFETIPLWRYCFCRYKSVDLPQGLRRLPVSKCYIAVFVTPFSFGISPHFYEGFVQA